MIIKGKIKEYNIIRKCISYFSDEITFKKLDLYVIEATNNEYNANTYYNSLIKLFNWTPDNDSEILFLRCYAELIINEATFGKSTKNELLKRLSE